MSIQNDMRNSERFTLCAEPSVETMLAETMKEISDDIARLPAARDIRSILLGGGYGRAEGGVFRTPDGHSLLYNDMDFFVISQEVSAARRKEIDSELEPVRRKWAAKLGIDVDFSPARTRESLRSVSRTLMYRELQAGHKRIFGSPDSFALLPEPDFTSIPYSEGARLMMNRGAGLMMAWNRLREKRNPEGEDNDFIIRNIYKAVFGCGDAMLIRRNLYCAGLEARLKRLESLPELPEDLAEFYREALSFKSLPRRESPERLLEKWIAARSLWLRTAAAFFLGGTGEKTDASTVSAAIRSSPLAKEGNPFRNLLLNGIAFRLGLRELCWFSHPRRILLARLYDFLLEIPDLQGYSNTVAAITPSTWLRVWNRFN